jgi:putative ABC transport system permease protein
MLRHILAATFRHLARNRLHAAISVLGLATGFAAVLLAALIVRDQFGRDHFIPGYARIFLVTTAVTPPGQATRYLPNASTFVGARLAAESSAVEAMARLHLGEGRLRQGATAARERFYWADPDIFKLLPLPPVAGDLQAALLRPDALVLSRSMARKYFGTDAPLGQTLLLDEKDPFTVAAVIEDLPVNGTHLASGIFLSTLSPRSDLQRSDRDPANVPGSPIGFGTNTYLRLAAGASPDLLQASLPAITNELFSRPPDGWQMALQLVRMDRLNTDPDLNPGAAARALMILYVALGILLIAGANFINLMTARSLQRSPEVAVRRLAGASRGMVASQFLFEATGYVALAMLLAVACVELVLPRVNAFLESGIVFDYWRHPLMLCAMLGAILLCGVLAGCGPALVLSGMRPFSALRGVAANVRGRGVARRMLVTLQFSMLIALLIAVGVVYRQQQFATRDALHFDTDQLLLVRGPCRESFVAEVRRLPGVHGLACGAGLLGEHSIGTLKSREGVEQLIFFAAVEPGLFDLYGVAPLAGTLTGEPGGTYYVLNETAAQRLGYADPADAVGAELRTPGADAARTSKLIGVVPDFSLTSVQNRIEAMAYRVTPRDPAFNVVSIKLSGAQVAQTLAAIDGLWKRSGAVDPITRYFADEYIQRLYAGLMRQGRMLAALCGLAMLLAAAGLLGLAAAVAERRTREIGIRKALGATTRDLLRLLLWEFARPVVWANLIAWPIAGWAMQRWLNGFAYHADLPLWLFPAAALVTLAIALATVSAHAVRVAGAKPVAALRCE